MKKLVGILEVGKELRFETREMELADMQEIVGGYIEIPYIEPLKTEGIDIVINEEGKFLEECEPNFVFAHNQEVVDIVMGTVIFIGFNGEGESISLTDKQVQYLKEKLFSSDKVILTKQDGESLELSVVKI